MQDSNEHARQVFVAAWAGDEVPQIALHPPFNLTLRLLISLCPDIIFPVSPAAAAAFDETHKPFESGEGITKDYSVQQHTSAHTALQVPPLHDLHSMVQPSGLYNNAARMRVSMPMADSSLLQGVTMWAICCNVDVD